MNIKGSRWLMRFSLLLALVLFSACCLVACNDGEDPALNPDAEAVYQDAIVLLGEGKYEEAYAKFVSIKDEKGVGAYLDRFVWVCTEETYTNHSGSFTRTTKYTCDGSGRILQATETDSNGGKRVTEYRYGETDGRLLETKRSVDGVVDYTVQYSYNADGLLASKKYVTDAFGEYVHTYEYDENGNLIKENDGFPDSPCTVEYSYDSQGRLVETKQTYGGPMPSATVTAYSYGDDGRISGGEVSYRGADGSETRSTQEYSNGLLVKETAHYYDGDVVMVYEYDAHGNRTKVKGDTTTEFGYALFYRSEAK